MTDIKSSILSADILAEIRNKVSGFVSKRATCKSKITKFSNKLHDLSEDVGGSLTDKLYKIHKDCITTCLEEVQKWDKEISNFLSDSAQEAASL